jgi:hypothetical protein
VTMPSTVTNIGDYAFLDCWSLATVAFPKGATSIGANAFLHCFSLPSVTFPNSAVSIGEFAFAFCRSLTNVTVPNSATSIGGAAFYNCTELTGVYFQANAPTADPSAFSGDANATAYYLPGTTGWDVWGGGIPTAMWTLPNPLILNNAPNFGLQTAGFGFTISWATNASIVVEASASLANPVWQPLQTNTITVSKGTFYFIDSQWTNYGGRFYRIRSL